MQRICIEIGRWKSSLQAEFDNPLLSLPLSYQKFLTPYRAKADWNLEIAYGKLPSQNGMELIYDTRASWALYKDGDVFWYRRPAPADGKAFSLLRLEKDRKEAVIFVGKIGSYKHKKIPFFVHPLDHLLFFYWISFYPAMIAHACGVGSNDFGYAFLGHSGFGKSTLTRLFQQKVPGTFGAPPPKRARHLLLSDDRLIIAAQEKGWRLFGTPWPGEADVFSKASFPLKKIVFLKHGKQNRLTPVPPALAGSRLFAMSFPVLWNKEKTDHALELASKIAQDIEAFEFEFLPDPSAIDYLEKNLF